MRRSTGVAVAFLLSAPALLPAQYFGQNKVQYTAFDFKIIQTEHFDVYYYDKERTASMDAARMAERSYAMLSRILGHDYKERKPLIFYASHSDFVQTNIFGGESPGEGTGGVTEFFRQRMVLPFTGSYADLEHVLQHEMTHQFQYDVFGAGHAGAGLQTLVAVAPPLWYMEGMAEYLSLGPVDPNTAMWLRDAVLNGTLPSITQLERDPYIFPYRFGHAIWAFIGERWGDEAIGAILRATPQSGIPGAIQRTLGISQQELSDLWQASVRRRYLPKLADEVQAKDFATEVLSRAKSEGTLHLAPALSPDGKLIAYFSERNTYFVDMYLADATTGQVKRRLLKSSYSSDYETYRFINSAASWSRDGKWLVAVAKHGPRDDILIGDVAKNKLAKRIKVQLNGASTPTWSPDAKQIVFTGVDGGISDLFIVNADGSGFRRLTNDKYTDLHPVWSPDGKTIAWGTDRGPGTDFQDLRIGNMRIALYHLDTDSIEVLPFMDGGKNVSPQWSPDGHQIAFVSDRTGVSNIYLYDLDRRQIFQITNVFTGVQGITPLSPVLSWAPQADRMAFVYYENQEYNVYTMDNPRSFMRQPDQQNDSVATPLFAGNEAQAPPNLPEVEATQQDAPVLESVSLYRTPEGFRLSGEAPTQDSVHAAPPGISIATLLDSATYALPDTAEFTLKKYKVKYFPDYIARPTIGYVRTSYGSGFYGGSAISLSDLMGDHTLVFSLFVNGRILEAQVLAAYINTTHRIGWGVGLSQNPYYYYDPSVVLVNQPAPGQNTLVTRLRRNVIRALDLDGFYPFTRFQRVEFGVRFASVHEAIQSIFEPYDASTGFPTTEAFSTEVSLGTSFYFQPQASLVYDNTLPGYVGPFVGVRYRLSIAQAVGGWTFTTAAIDYRRYDRIFGPIVLATRALYAGRIGPDANRFEQFIGYTILVRGNTPGSYQNNECLISTSSCVAFDRLSGTQIAVGNAELRFPIFTPAMSFVPRGFPPIEGALFYDIGIAWEENSTLMWEIPAGDNRFRDRAPSRTFGVSVRTNLFGIMILRADWAFPQTRPGVGNYWTVSIGPVW